MLRLLASFVRISRSVFPSLGGTPLPQHTHTQQYSYTNHSDAAVLQKKNDCSKKPPPFEGLFQVKLMLQSGNLTPHKLQSRFKHQRI